MRKMGWMHLPLLVLSQALDSTTENQQGRSARSMSLPVPLLIICYDSLGSSRTHRQYPVRSRFRAFLNAVAIAIAIYESITSTTFVTVP